MARKQHCHRHDKVYVVTTPWNSYEFKNMEEAISEAEKFSFLDGDGYPVRVFEQPSGVRI